MENLKECVGPREYSVVSQANFCYNGLPALYNLGFVGKLHSFDKFNLSWIRYFGAGHCMVLIDFHWNPT